MKMKQIDVFENKHLSTEAVKNICNDLQRDRTEMLSIRNCRIADKDFKKVCKSVGVCRSLRHLALTVNVVCDGFRVQVLAQGLHKNTSLIGLHLHGNAITDNDMKSLYPHLHNGSRLSVLDLSEGKLGDQGLDVVSCLMKEHKALLELTLSHNPNITTDGWSRFGMAIASGTGIRSLAIDYNDIGDIVACCFATALPGAQQLEFLDLECTGITDKAAQIFLHLVMSYNSKLKKINLKRNQVLKSTTEAIKLHLSTNNSHGRFITDDDEGSLTTSEPPISKNDYEYMANNTSERLSSFTEMDFVNRDIENVDCIPVVEVSPAFKDDRVFNANALGFDGSVRTKSMVAAVPNNGHQIKTEFETKRAFSLNDLRRILPNEITEGEGKEMNEEYETYVPDDDDDAPEDDACMAMTVQNVNDDDDFDFEFAKFESSSQHSVKGFDETDDTFKSEDPSPALYQKQEPETDAVEGDAQTDNMTQKHNKHVVVASVENVLPPKTLVKITDNAQEIEVRPVKAPEITTKDNGTSNFINATKPDFPSASWDNHNNKDKTSGSLAPKVISVRSKGDDKYNTQGSLASKVMSVAPRGVEKDTASNSLASKVMSVAPRGVEDDSAPDSLATKFMSVEPKMNDGTIDTKIVTEFIDSNVKDCDTYDSNIDIIKLPSTNVETEKQNKDASGDGDMPKVNKRRGKRNKTQGIDLAAAIRQNRNTSEA